MATKKRISIISGLVIMFFCSNFTLMAQERDSYIFDDKTYSFSNEIVWDNGERFGSMYVNDNEYCIVNYEIGLFEKGNISYYPLIESGEKLACFGPLSLYKIESTVYVSCIDGELREKGVVSDNLSVLKEKISIKSADLLQASSEPSINNVNPHATTSYVNTFLPHFVPAYNYSPNGICGATAAAMAIKYMDYYVSSIYVPSSLEDLQGINLIKDLAPRIHGSLSNPVPAYTSDVVAGMNAYFSAYGISNSMSQDVYSFNRVNGQIASYKRPVVIFLLSSPTYGNHFVTAYGTRQDLSTGKNYIYMLEMAGQLLEKLCLPKLP